jgi:hypothetical protein
MSRALFVVVVPMFLAVACGPPPAPEPPPDFSKTVITGKLGELGDAKPMVSSLFISNSGETLVYMATEPLSCNGLTISRWLGQTPEDTQVVEVVIKGDPEVKDYPVPPGEVNYAKGGRSSAFEVNADGGSISFHTAKVSELVEGQFTANYGADTVSGTFHATFCDGGQGY